MLNWIREKFGPTVIGIIIGFIAFVFIFFGVFNPSKTRGLHEGAVAGTVNGESISVSDFQRAFQSRIEFYRNMSGGKLTDAQIQAGRLKESVFQELVQQKLLAQAATQNHFGGSDEAVRERIASMDVFKQNGRFDPVHYKQVLTANRYNPSQFEKLLRDEVVQGEWRDYFKNRMKVSPKELENEFLMSENKRMFKYVMITQEASARNVKIPAAEIAAALQDQKQLPVLKAQYELRKAKEYKGKSFDDVKAELASQSLVLKKPELLKKGAAELATVIKSKLKVGKADAELTAFLKPYGLEVKSTALMSESENYFPGMGEVKDLKREGFMANSPIDVTHGKQPGVYDNGSWTIVAGVVEVKTPDMKSFDPKTAATKSQLKSKKEQALYQAWMKELKEKAAIKENSAVVSSENTES